MEKQKVVLTGGAGYIGSHTAVELLDNGYDVVIIDNLSNSCKEAVESIEKITEKKVTFYQTDLCNLKELDSIFEKEKPDSVIHFAGLKAVGESVEKPLLYYNNNLVSTLNLLETMLKYDVKKLIFSSSATVYGSSPSPCSEDSPIGVGITNPYGQTKYMIECILKDVATAYEDFEIIALRYFNPVGAHESGMIGEDPNGMPNNLMPIILQVAVGKREKLMVFGDDYDTEDGTGVRDYIHVVDLAKGHIAALKHLTKGFDVFNLGSGKGYSVLEMVHTFEKVTGQKIPYEITSRRAGDLATVYAKVDKAKEVLQWQTEKTIEDMCRDSWRWQKKNPNGYKREV